MKRLEIAILIINRHVYVSNDLLLKWSIRIIPINKQTTVFEKVRKNPNRRIIRIT